MVMKMKTNLMSLDGFGDIDVPVIQDDLVIEKEEPEVMLVNPCTGLFIPNANTGNMVDTGGHIFGTGCDDEITNASSDSLIEDTSNSNCDDIFNNNDTFDSFCNDDAFDCSMADSGFDDF